ncbi:MAG TPA: RNA-binding transcriptional accessory protein [Saprospiraceae bacterium]|nr:RNA-binding transcriptional accessory protein [Saprospiraceae bacterium]
MQQTDFVVQSTGLSAKGVRATLELLAEGATIPFIARYRKERTGSFNEVDLDRIKQAADKYSEIIKRKESILKSIEEQGKLTDGLRKQIENSWDLTEIEDVYLPFKRKRKTRAAMAREKGLEPLAKRLMSQHSDNVEQLAKIYLSEKVESTEDALQGARDIIAEWVNEDIHTRSLLRRLFERSSTVQSRSVKSKEEEPEAVKYKDYFDFEEPLKYCPSHRLLAIRRGEQEGFLRMYIGPDSEEAIDKLHAKYVQGHTDASGQVAQAIEDAYKRLLKPSLETEFRVKSKTLADEEAIQVFAENLSQLLLEAPLGKKRVLGLDPGFRTGCKVVVLSQNGDLLQNTTIYPHPPQSRWSESVTKLKYLVKNFEVDAIAVGNGTAGRETIDLCKSIDFERKVSVFSVNESGASIYSASKIAREEFPDHDITVRGAVSIGRRLMDPLAELVKIDAKSIGVGQYQHDVNQTRLKESLDRVVESAVNSVGVNLNTASKHLLTYVSGLGPTIAANIVDWRTDNGAFRSRADLKKVPRLGGKAYEQAAGFLRIRRALNPLDDTAVHPERYGLVEQMAKDMGVQVTDLIRNDSLLSQIKLSRYMTDDLGMPTLKDIIGELKKPGLDPRGEAQVFEFANVRSVEELRPGMTLPGIITNITNFGAFVDVGVKQDGLVHISQLANKFVKNPMDVVSLRQKVMVRVVEVDVPRKRISLSMKDV